METIDNVVNEVFEECDKEINKSGAKAELNNVIVSVSDCFDIEIEDIYDMKVESLMEYVIDMCR